MSRGGPTCAPHVPRRALVRELSAHGPVILPSMLLCDFGNLEREVERLEAAGVRALHLDVMDGHFVPNLTYGLTIVKAVHQLTDLPLDVHLMIGNPAEYVDRYIEAGADLVTIHFESTGEPGAILERIREMGAAAGLAVNPQTPIEEILPLVNLCDMVLVMCVEPGFGGQSFDRRALDRLRALRIHNSVSGDRSMDDESDHDSLLLQVDGGVNDTTIAECTAAGANLLVVGSAIFGHDDYTERIGRLSRLADGRRTGHGKPWEEKRE